MLLLPEWQRADISFSSDGPTQVPAQLSHTSSSLAEGIKDRALKGMFLILCILFKLEDPGPDSSHPLLPLALLRISQNLKMQISQLHFESEGNLTKSFFERRKMAR